MGLRAYFVLLWLHTGAICLVEHLSDGLAPDVVPSAFIAQNPAPSSTPPEFLHSHFRTGFLVQRFAEAHYNSTGPSDDSNCASHIGIERHRRSKEVGIICDARAYPEDGLKPSGYVGDSLW